MIGNNATSSASSYWGSSMDEEVYNCLNEDDGDLSIYAPASAEFHHGSCAVYISTFSEAKQCMETTLISVPPRTPRTHILDLVPKEYKDYKIILRCIPDEEAEPCQTHDIDGYLTFPSDHDTGFVLVPKHGRVKPELNSRVFGCFDSCPYHVTSNSQGDVVVYKLTGEGDTQRVALYGASVAWALSKRWIR